MDVGHGAVPDSLQFNAAACCARGPQCFVKHARLSGVCGLGLWMAQQSDECRVAACAFCRRDRKKSVCKTYPILRLCFNQKEPYPKPDPQWAMIPSSLPKPYPSVNPRHAVSAPPAPADCSYNVNNGLLRIPAKGLEVRSPWFHNTADGGITWKPMGGNGIDQPQEGKPFCLNFTPDRDGLIYFTVRSSASQFTEHNDFWYKVSAPVVLYRPSSKNAKRWNGGWMKLFQNVGPKMMANYVLSGDNNGHQVFIEGLKGKKIRICGAGRSSKFTIYDFLFVNCDGLDGCDRDKLFVTNIMKNLPPPARCQ